MASSRRSRSPKPSFDPKVLNEPNVSTARAINDDQDSRRHNHRRGDHPGCVRTIPQHSRAGILRLLGRDHWRRPVDGLELTADASGMSRHRPPRLAPPGLLRLISLHRDCLFTGAGDRLGGFIELTLGTLTRRLAFRNGRRLQRGNSINGQPASRNRARNATAIAFPPARWPVPSSRFEQFPIECIGCHGSYSTSARFGTGSARVGYDPWHPSKGNTIKREPL